ncbi:formylglycine-generating enzyme family protein [Planctomycetota bacterium]
MKKNNWINILILFACISVCWANTAPEVSEVTAIPRTDGSGIVDISYTLADVDGDSCVVGIQVSDDGGVTWEIIPRISALSGDVGKKRILPGDWHINWDSKIDLLGEFDNQYRVKIIADDSYSLPPGMAFVFIQSGTFEMGSNDGESNEKPIHTVNISQRFWMGKYEVTQEQYQSIMGNNPSYFKGNSNPVEQLSWNDAVLFCQKLTDQERIAGHLLEGYEYRLPTEAEWEYAARGGSGGVDTVYSGSNSISDVAWYSGNSGNKPHPVGQKQANELGIYDMTGNVSEWCFDWYGSYANGSQTDPAGPSTGLLRIVRGRSWISRATLCRVANRLYSPPTWSGRTMGFRVVLAPAVQ